MIGGVESRVFLLLNRAFFASVMEIACGNNGKPHITAVDDNTYIIRQDVLDRYRRGALC
jgi:hypothetical protein